MPIFISHSVAPKELALIDAMAGEVLRRGERPIIPRRDWNPDNAIPEDIRTQIRDSNCIIGIATQGGHHYPWLNVEVSYSQELNPPRPLILVADAEVPINPSYQRIVINRNNPFGTISEVAQRIQRLVQDRDTQNLITGLVVGGLILLFLYFLTKE